jgi:hypothetical protein
MTCVSPSMPYSHAEKITGSSTVGPCLAQAAVVARGRACTPRHKHTRSQQAANTYPPYIYPASI